jgi:hypothetical protein
MRAARRFLDRPHETWIVFACFALASVPVVWVSFPPVLDYPNHLARIWLLGGGADLPPVSSMYIVDWSRAPTNSGVDWIAAHLARILPFPVVDRLLRLLMFLGPPLGAACLGRAVFGRLSAWQLAPLALAWGATSIAGFMSYSIGIAAAMFCAIVVQYRQGRIDPATLGIHALLSFILLAIHPWSLFFYLALVTGIVLGPRLVSSLRLRSILDLARTMAAFILIGLMPLLVMLLSSKSPPGTGAILWGSLSDYISLKAIIKKMIGPILSYNIAIDILFVAPIVVLVGLTLIAGRLRFHVGFVVVATVLAVASLFVPHAVGDAAWLQYRLPSMAALTGIVAILPQPKTSRWSSVMLLMLAATALLRTVWIGSIWNARDQDVADLNAVTLAVKPGDAVVVVRQDTLDTYKAPLGRHMVGAIDGTRPVRRHLPALLVTSRKAFIPTLFAVPGQHAIKVAPDRTTNADALSSIPVPQALHEIPGPRDAYLSRWRCDFQYLLLIGADEATASPLAANGLKLVASRGFAALYAIEPLASPGQPCGPSGG